MSGVYSALGEATTLDGRLVVQTRKGEAGFPLYGPYLELPPGRYSVEFGIALVEEGGPADEVLGTVEVFAGGIGIIVERRFSRADLQRAGAGPTVEFNAPIGALLEFRVQVTGAAALRVDQDWALTSWERNLLAPPGEASTEAWFPARRPQTYRRFALLNIAQLQGVAPGSRMVPDGDGVLITVGGLTLHLNNLEDFQIIAEVLLHRVYRFGMAKPACVIDVGMNVGLASLFFASLGCVEEVHSFEPFEAPFQRACRNFALNPALSSKIKPANVGLSDHDSDDTVFYDTSATIGSSVLGVGSGTPCRISVRNAANALGGIIDGARRRGLAVVVKLDCEGSEFPIMDVLSRHGMVGKIDAFLIEWHKWWEGGTTQERLVDPLLANGFTVLDQTLDSNPHAGQIYAVRAAA